MQASCAAGAARKDVGIPRLVPRATLAGAQLGYVLADRLHSAALNFDVAVWHKADVTALLVNVRC
jgi:hypothetical protein